MVRRVRYHASASLLYRLAKQLQPPERACFLSGIELSPTDIALTEAFFVPGRSSEVEVVPSPAGVSRLQQYLDELGLSVHCIAHSHPGLSWQATFPSAKDIGMACIWERHAPFIGAIISEGGRFLRFFNFLQISEVIMYGTHKRLFPGVFELPACAEPGLPEQASQQPGLPNPGSVITPAVVEPGANVALERSGSRVRGLRQFSLLDADPDGSGRNYPD